MINNCFTGFYEGFVKDLRNSKRLDEFAFNMLNLGSSVINRITNVLTSKIAFYRMINNPRFDHQDLLEASYSSCVNSINCTHVLAIQDTTEFNYNTHIEKIKSKDNDLGPTSNYKIAGFFCHPVLTLNPKTSEIYGFLDVKIYNRDWDNPNRFERNYKSLSIEEKESNRWIESTINSKNRLGNKNVKVTFVGDRESDIYEEIAEVPNEMADILVRVRLNRRIVQGKLYDYLDNSPTKGCCYIEVTGKNKRKKRTAKLEIKFEKVTIKAPKRYKGEKKIIDAYAIEVKEHSSTIPKDEEPIIWRLLTSHEVENLKQAIECVGWYKQRWLIEELFRVIKSKGFKIEESQLSTGKGLKKLLAITLQVALITMKLKLSLNNLEVKSESVFDQDELKCLELINKKLEGETEKQKNPYPKNTLANSAWIMARLGGWSGYKSHGVPGYITIKTGYDKFVSYYQGYRIFLE